MLLDNPGWCPMSRAWPELQQHLMLILSIVILSREEVFGVPEIALVKDVYLWLVSRLSIFIPMLQHALLAESHFEVFFRYMLKEPFNFLSFCTTY
jgi:hypothetical protein